MNIRAAPLRCWTGIAYCEHFEVQHASTQKCLGGGIKLNRIFIKMIWMWICWLMDSNTYYIGMGIYISLVCHSDMWRGDNVYCILFCRGLVIAIFSPILRHTGYGLSWQEGMVMTWGGLRGAVGLALALQVAHHDEIDSETVGIRVSRRPIHCMCGVRVYILKRCLIIVLL